MIPSARRGRGASGVSETILETETPSAAAQDKQNGLLKAVWLLRAKARSQALAYSCCLDNQPADLAPRAARQALEAAAAAADLVVNPTLLYQAGAEPPARIQERGLLLDAFKQDEPLAWIEEPGSGIWTAYWAPGAWAGALAALQPGLSPPADLAPAMRRALAMAEILVPPDHAAARRMQWERVAATAAAEYQAQGYTIVRGLIPPLQLGAMRRYYRALVAGGTLLVGDDQVAERYCLHSELVASFFHPQLAGLVSRVVGETARPSYVYFASYKPGADLPRHVDRAQCEFSISLLVDYLPEPEGPSGWPLCMEDPRTGAAGAADLGLGDAVIYRGRELVHYRDPLPAEHHSTSVFLHYVREDFRGALY
jgi:hypothetical protein